MVQELKDVQYFPHNNEEKGIIQHIYKHFPNSIHFKCSSSAPGYGNTSAILSYEDWEWWESKNESDSYFAVNFPLNRVLLNSFSLMSCKIGQCVYSLQVLGSNDNDEWDEICNITEDPRYFFNQTGNVKCQSELPYSIIKFVHTGINDRGELRFPIHFLELFGYLEKNRKCTFYCTNNHISYSSYLIFLILPGFKH